MTDQTGGQKREREKPQQTIKGIIDREKPARPTHIVHVSFFFALNHRSSSANISAISSAMSVVMHGTKQGGNNIVLCQLLQLSDFSKRICIRSLLNDISMSGLLYTSGLRAVV